MRDEKTSRLVLTALMTCLVLVATMSIRIPSPFTHGYVHLGDSMIFLSVLLLGKKGGAAASGLGSCLADLCGGYGMYAPWTLLIKAVMAFIMGAFIERMIKRDKKRIKILGIPVIELTGMTLAGLEMVVGYGFVDGFFAGNLLTGFLGAPMNVAQFVTGMILAGLLAAALYRTPAKKIFTYRLDEIK